MTDSMVERVARALARNFGLSHYADDPEYLRRYVDTSWPSFESQARAAIAAMREPTEAMDTAGYLGGRDAADPYEPGNIAVVTTPIYRAMIDAALKE